MHIYKSYFHWHHRSVLSNTGGIECILNVRIYIPYYLNALFHYQYPKYVHLQSLLILSSQSTVRFKFSIKRRLKYSKRDNIPYRPFIQGYLYYQTSFAYQNVYKRFSTYFFTDCFVYVALTVHASREYHSRKI